MSNVHFTAVANKTKRNWQLTKTKYEIKLINRSQKLVKAVQWKYRIRYNSSYANLNTTKPTQNLKKPTQPNPTQPNLWMYVVHGQLCRASWYNGTCLSSGRQTFPPPDISPPDISPLTNPLPDVSPSAFRRSRTFPPRYVVNSQHTVNNCLSGVRTFCTFLSK